MDSPGSLQSQCSAGSLMTLPPAPASQPSPPRPPRPPRPVVPPLSPELLGSSQCRQDRLQEEVSLPCWEPDLELRGELRDPGRPRAQRSYHTLVEITTTTYVHCFSRAATFVPALDLVKREPPAKTLARDKKQNEQ